MPIYTDKRSGRLFVQFDYKKQTFKQYLPVGSTRTYANTVETKMRFDAFDQANGLAPKDEILFEDAVQDYLGHIKGQSKYYRAEMVLIAAKPFLKGKSLRQIKPLDIERYIRYREASPIQYKTKQKIRQPATIWREVSVLSALFSFAVKNDMCETNPCIKVDKPSFDNVQSKVLPIEDEAKFLASFESDTARDICLLVLNTGLRQNDVLRLTSFQIRDGFIRLVQGKTKRIVEIPLNAPAREIVSKRNGLLFPSSHPLTKGKPMKSIRTAIATACSNAEIEPVTIRDLRRTFATRLAENGVDALTIALLLGHSDLRMVHRYARSVKAMQNAVDKLVKPTLRLPYALQNIAN